MGYVYSAKQVADNVKVAVVVSRFNDLLTKELLDGALDALERHSAADNSDADVYWVPGSFELPATARKLAESGRYDGVLALGALVRGNTDHYELLASEVTKGLANLSMQEDVPISFGVLTCDTLDKALERAGTKSGNKGAEAMISLIEMMNLYGAIDAGPEDEEGEPTDG